MAVAASADKPLRLRRGEGLKSQASNGSAADEDPSSAGAEILDYWRNLLEAEGGSLPTMPPVAPPTLSPTTSSPIAAPTPVPQPTSAAPTAKCNQPPDERAAQLTIDILRVSDPAKFVDEASPQKRALDWLVDADDLGLCAGDPELLTRYSLAVFFFATDGPNWTQCGAPTDPTDPASIAEANANCNLEVEIGQGGTQAWLTPVPICEWGALQCSIDGELVRIEFERNNLGGTIPDEIGELSELRFLHMEEGRTSGPIPESLGNLNNLLELDMNFNELTGSIPENLFNLSNLLEFDLNDNNLSGAIGPGIANMSSLTFIQLHRNELSGTIPPEIGALDRLIVATFDSNNFEDPMPEEVCRLREGDLRTLTSDCLDPESETFVDCPVGCCTQCF
jgi:hypothetical protein